MKKLGKTHPTRWGRSVLFSAILVLVAILLIGGYWFYRELDVVAAERDYQEIARLADTRVAEIEAKKKEPVYISFPGAEPIQAPPENYEDPTNFWTLVNKERALPMDYVPPKLVSPNLPIRTNATADERTLREVIVKPLTDMFEAAAKEGHMLMIGSAYRSSATQDTLFNSYVASAGYAEANRYSAHPGHSEHQTGLAVDISTTSQQCYLSACFIATADGMWLAENAHKYGFILRYPEGKEAITGYNFEPWHYRYVGVPLATALHKSGLTLDQAWPYLEEALETLRENRAVPRTTSGAN